MFAKGEQSYKMYSTYLGTDYKCVIILLQRQSLVFGFVQGVSFSCKVQC